MKNLFNTFTTSNYEVIAWNVKHDNDAYNHSISVGHLQFEDGQRAFVKYEEEYNSLMTSAIVTVIADGRSKSYTITDIVDGEPRYPGCCNDLAEMPEWLYKLLEESRLIDPRDWDYAYEEKKAYYLNSNPCGMMNYFLHVTDENGDVEVIYFPYKRLEAMYYCLKLRREGFEAKVLCEAACHETQRGRA